MPEVSSILYSEDELQTKPKKRAKNPKISQTDLVDNPDKPTKNRNFFVSVKNAWNGILVGQNESSHVRFHMFVGIFILMLSFFLNLTYIEWSLVIFLMGAIISAELFNSAIEDICNLLRDKAGVDYAFTGKAKDIGSGAVLILAIISVAVFIMVYVPKLLLIFAILRA